MPVKTYFLIFPRKDLWMLNNSFIATDPKGEIARATANMLKKNGYNVKVLNLIDMAKSDGYNPFRYIREENFNSKDSVQLQALGYYSVLIPISELLHDTTITLQEKQYLLTEANVKGIHPTKILKKAASYLKSHPTGHTYSIYGRGLYMKITECKNKAVELRKEYGYFLDTSVVVYN